MSRIFIKENHKGFANISKFFFIKRKEIMKKIFLLIFSFMSLFFSVSQADNQIQRERSSSEYNPPKMERILTDTDDQDGDGISDQWEDKAGLDTSRNDSLEDPDADGLSNADEFRYGSNPFCADTDEDLLKDKEEVSSHGTDPVNEDTDGDGKSDYDEISKGTDPLYSDDEGSITKNIYLKEGWNLISFPVSPPVTNIETILAPISGLYSSVWSYQNGKWKMYDPEKAVYSDLTTMDAGWGYWINMNISATLTLSGSTPLNLINLVSGWNLIGYNYQVSLDIAQVLTMLDNKYISVWGYIEGKWKSYNPEMTEFSDLTTLEPCYGYWVNIAEPCALILP